MPIVYTMYERCAGTVSGVSSLISYWEISLFHRAYIIYVDLLRLGAVSVVSLVRI